MKYVVKGWKLYSPHDETACSLDEAIETAWWARNYNFWAPRTVEHEGAVILDEASLDEALRTFDPFDDGAKK